MPPITLVGFLTLGRAGWWRSRMLQVREVQLILMQMPASCMIAGLTHPDVFGGFDRIVSSCSLR